LISILAVNPDLLNIASISFIIIQKKGQARSSLYANTQLRAHRRAEKNKEQKTKKKQNKE
jgi:hypothetical protein